MMMMETMESSFYQDLHKGVKSLKSSMTLDFTSDKTKQRKMADMLNSPDIHMLKLASPELERLIIQQGGVSTTPTATPNTQILFPKSVTEEQEAYARGFVDALAELHQKPGGTDDDDDDDETDMVTIVNDGSQATGLTYTTLTNASSNSNAFTKQHTSQISNPHHGGVYTYTTVAQLPNSALPNTNAVLPLNSMNIRAQDIIIRNQPMTSRTSSPAMSFTGSPHHSQVMQVKDEPQRVPSLSPQLAPINMVHQETIKLSRKRARNRVAARKCRTRKLERISRLEDRVDDLKGHNTKLVNTASELREQVFALKQQILEHVNSGCKVMLSANVL